VDAGVLEKLGRLFWYTVEFGVIRQRDGTKVYGSGLLSSHGERLNVMEGHCAIHDFTLDEVLNTPVKVDELHKLLFAVSSFDQVYEAMHEAERRAVSGPVVTVVRLPGIELSIGSQTITGAVYEKEQRAGCRIGISLALHGRLDGGGTEIRKRVAFDDEPRVAAGQGNRKALAALMAALHARKMRFGSGAEQRRGGAARQGKAHPERTAQAAAR